MLTEPSNIARFLTAFGEPTDVPGRSPSADAAAAVLGVRGAGRRRRPGAPSVEEHRPAPQGARRRPIAARTSRARPTPGGRRVPAARRCAPWRALRRAGPALSTHERGVATRAVPPLRIAAPHFFAQRSGFFYLRASLRPCGAAPRRPPPGGGRPPVTGASALAPRYRRQPEQPTDRLVNDAGSYLISKRDGAGKRLGKRGDDGGPMCRRPPQAPRARGLPVGSMPSEGVRSVVWCPHNCGKCDGLRRFATAKSLPKFLPGCGRKVLLSRSALGEGALRAVRRTGSPQAGQLGTTACDKKVLNALPVFKREGSCRMPLPYWCVTVSLDLAHRGLIYS
jgi:hypothetical protein